MKTKIFCFSILFIFACGIFFRFFDLGNIPPGIHYDEAFNGLDAISALKTGDYKIFYTSNTGREGLHINSEAFFIRLFGTTNFGLRFANALWGTLAIIGFFFLLRELKFSRPAILAGTFSISFSFWFLDLSRTAYRAIMVPMILIWIFLFFMRGISHEKYKAVNFGIAGILLGLGFHTYIAFRATPIIFLLLAITLVIFKKNFIRNYWKYAAVFFIVSLSIALPILLYFSQHRSELMVRAESVSIFDNPQVSWITAFRKSFFSHLGAFIWWGDGNPRYNYNRQPFIPLFWQVFFLAGFALSARELYRNFRALRSSRKAKSDFEPTRMFYASAAAQIAFWIMLIPGVLSIEGVPHSLRIIGTIPSAMLFLALPFEYFWDYAKNYRKLAIIFFALFFAGGFYQMYVYFFLWANDARTAGGYEKKLYDLGGLVNELPLHKNNYLILTRTAAISQDNRESSFKSTEYVSYPKIKNYVFYRPIEKNSNINCDDPLIILYESDDWLRHYYQGMCPGLNFHYQTPPNGQFGFWYLEK